MIEQNIGLHIIQLLAGIVLLSTVTLHMSNTTKRYVVNFMIQSLALAGLAAFLAYFNGNSHLYIAAVLTLVLKVLIIPALITFSIKKIGLVEEKEVFVNIAGQLILMGIIVVFSYFVIQPIEGQASTITQSIMPLAVSVVLIGIVMLIIKKKANTQIFAMLVIENGLVLASLASTYGVPLVVELGVTFDIFVAVIVMIVYMMRMHDAFHTINTSQLMELKE